MPNWLRDFAAGMQIGESFMDNVRESKLRRGLSDLDKQQIEEVYAEAPADPNTEQSKMLAAQNEGLTTELPPTPTVSGYKYGDQTFQYKPPTEYVDALKAKQRAALFEQYGDIDKAQVYREAATKQLADSYKTIAETAFAKGTPEAIVSAYSLINDGFDAKLEKNPDGALRVLLYPEGQPDKTEEIFSGDSASVVDWAMRNTNPELYLKFADAATMRDYRKSLLEDRQLAREDRGLVAQDRARQQNETNVLRQIQILDRRAQQALAAGQEDVFISASQQRDALEARLSGLTGAGGASGNGNYSGIISSLNRTESNGPEDWNAEGPVTRSGQRAIGRLQFMPDRLQEAQRALGIQFTPEQFKASPQLQQMVENWHFQDIDQQIAQRGLDRYIGQTRGGQTITLDGLRAGAHLGGIGGLTKFLETDGGYNANDGRTAISDYVGFHAGDGASTQGLTGAPASSGIDYKKMYASGRQTATAMRPATNLSPAQRDKIIQEVEDEVMLDPEFSRLSPDAQQQLIQTRIAERLARAASPAGAAPTDAVSTQEQRMERFRTILGIPSPT